MLLNKKIDRGTGRGDDNILSLLAYLLFIFTLDYRGSDRGLLRVGEAKLLQGLAYGVYTAVVPAGVERGGYAGDDRSIALKHYADPLGVVNYLFCILRTNNKALAAEYTLIADYVSLMPREADRLDRTSAYTSVAVFAVGLFQLQYALHGKTSLYQLLINKLYCSIKEYLRQEEMACIIRKNVKTETEYASGSDNNKNQGRRSGGGRC